MWGFVSADGKVWKPDTLESTLASVDLAHAACWATSTAAKGGMFNNSPGSIAGKTNDVNGTPR